MVIRLTSGGPDFGPYGPDPKKPRAKREQELQQLANTKDGCDIVLYLWKAAKGIPAGQSPPGSIGTLVRQEMIPEILAHEYPNG